MIGKKSEWIRLMFLINEIGRKLKLPRKIK